MTRQRFPSNPHYLQSVRGLHWLHALAMAEKDNTPEAEAVRDSLNGPWLHQTATEKKRSASSTRACGWATSVWASA